MSTTAASSLAYCLLGPINTAAPKPIWTKPVTDSSASTAGCIQSCNSAVNSSILLFPVYDTQPSSLSTPPTSFSCICHNGTPENYLGTYAPAWFKDPALSNCVVACADGVGTCGGPGGNAANTNYPYAISMYEVMSLPALTSSSSSQAPSSTAATSKTGIVEITSGSISPSSTSTSTTTPTTSNATDNTTGSSSSSNNNTTVAIIAGIVCSVLIIIVLLIFLFYRHRRSQQNRQYMNAKPSYLTSSSYPPPSSPNRIPLYNTKVDGGVGASTSQHNPRTLSRPGSSLSLRSNHQKELQISDPMPPVPAQYMTGHGNVSRPGSVAYYGDGIVDQYGVGVGAGHGPMTASSYGSMAPLAAPRWDDPHAAQAEANGWERVASAHK
ncbi:hypothetical protein HDU76_005320 [Blyttiomyces sp. JEL0837]|nr:hypothetical protein HDU76_005320 [Blyttiomyces sp. JEL0837]